MPFSSRGLSVFWYDAKSFHTKKAVTFLSKSGLSDIGTSKKLIKIS